MGALAAASLLVFPGVAGAATSQDGAIVDPDSPAGAEYAIPLDQARSRYGGPSPARAGGGSEPDPVDQRFGHGIAPARTGGDGGPAGSAAASSPNPATAAVPPPPASAVQAAGQSDSGTALGIGAGIGVLVLGLGFGALLRLRRGAD